MTSPDDFGPGVRWLAERAGVHPRELLASPALLLRSLGSALKDTADLAADSLSPDDEVRRTARERSTVLKEHLTSEVTPGERFAATIRTLLHRTGPRH